MDDADDDDDDGEKSADELDNDMASYDTATDDTPTDDTTTDVTTTDVTATNHDSASVVAAESSFALELRKSYLRQTEDFPRFARSADDDDDDDERVRRRLTTTEPNPADRGEFCWPWLGATEDWCFVDQGASCTMSDCEMVGTREVCKSAVPCGADAPSRSEYVIQGEDALSWIWKLLLILACCLLAEGCCAMILFSVPSPTPTVEELDVMGSNLPNADLEQRFSAAQEYVMQRLNDSTPEETRLKVYGLYKQSQEGNVRGARPGYDPMEMAKWDHWAANKNMSRSAAIEGYLRLANTL